MRKHWTWYNHWNKILGQWTTRGKNRRKGRLLLNLKNSKGKVIRKKRQKNKSELNQEEIAYESGTALDLNHNLLEQATVTPETFKEFERTVPIFTFRPPKKCPTGEISSGKGSRNITTCSPNQTRPKIFKIYTSRKGHFSSCYVSK